MKHVVVSEPHICPKCLKSNMGSAETILDLLICPKCAQKYRNKLMPKIEKQVREFFQPERLSEKTVNGSNAFNESMKVYEDCLSKPIPNEMKKLFCGSDSLTS